MFSNKEYVWEVYRERSFSKAAENLYITQSALSLAIKKVESRVGTQLFDRSTNPIQLTESGREYIKCAKQIMSIENGYQNFLSEVNGLQIGSLFIGGSNFFTSYILPPYITRFKEKYPKVKVNIVEGSTEAMEKNLFAGNLDIIVDNSDLSAELFRKIFFYSEQIILAVPKLLHPNELLQEYQLTAQDIAENKHREKSTPCVPIKAFADTPFVLLRQGNDTRKRADQVFQEHGVSPNIALEMEQMVTAYNISRHGIGAAFISDTFVKVTVPDPRVVYYRLDSQRTERINYFYHKKNRYLTKVMQEFLKIAQGPVQKVDGGIVL